MTKRTILAVVADQQGEVFEHPGLLMAGMNGREVRPPREDELIPLPEGSRLFIIPGTPPIGLDRRSRRQVAADRLPPSLGGGPAQAVSAFLTPAFTRTLLPAADYRRKKVQLPLWSYTAVGWCLEEERFYAAAVQVDRNPQWQPEHFDDRRLDPLVRQALRADPDNRLLEQLARCAVDYHCFAAKNLFFRRWEAPLPTSPACNSRCLGLHLPAGVGLLPGQPGAAVLRPDGPGDLRHCRAAPAGSGKRHRLLRPGLRGRPHPAGRYHLRGGARDAAADAPGHHQFQLQRLAAGGHRSAGRSRHRFGADLPQLGTGTALQRLLPPPGLLPSPMSSSRCAGRSGQGCSPCSTTWFSRRHRPAGGSGQALVRLVEEAGVDLVQMRNLSIDPVLYWQAMGVEGDRASACGRCWSG